MTTDNDKAVEKFAGNVARGLLKAVPEADLFAMLGDAEYADLKQSILNAGKINTPIHITPDGAIVDGRNRAKALHDLGLSRMDATEAAGHYEACTKARIAINLVVVAKADIASTVLRLNILRRHLSPEERARLVLRLTQRGHVAPGGVSVKAAAALAGVGERTMKRVRAKERTEAGQGPASAPGVPDRSRAERVAEMHQRLLLSAERNMPLLRASRDEARAAAERLVETLAEDAT
jgi:transposase-like protein